MALPLLNDSLSAAGIYQLGQATGYTIRSSADCLIAAVAIETRTPVWRKDRDYEAIAHYTSLRTRSLACKAMGRARMASCKNEE